MGLAEVDEREKRSGWIESVQEKTDLSVRVCAGEPEVLEPLAQGLLPEPVHRAGSNGLVAALLQGDRQIPFRLHRHQRVHHDLRLADLCQSHELPGKAIVEGNVVANVGEDAGKKGEVGGISEVGRRLSGVDLRKRVEHWRLGLGKDVVAAAVVGEEQEVVGAHRRDGPPGESA